MGEEWKNSRRLLPEMELSGMRGRKPGSPSAGLSRDDTKKERRGISNGFSADASKMMRRLLRKGDANARCRKPGSLHSADSGRDDTKNDTKKEIPVATCATAARFAGLAEIIQDALTWRCCATS